jgi:cystathionine gamma-synthase
MALHDDVTAPLRLSTLAVSQGRPDRQPGAALNSPMTLASAFVAGGASEYGRHANLTWDAFEQALGALEGGRAVSFASGMAAIAAAIDLAQPGSKVVAARHTYYGTVQLLREREELGLLSLQLVDIEDTPAVVDACTDAGLVWIESPTNPALEVADVDAIFAASREAGALVVVDNTFATPLRQRPLDLGADIVVHSASKLLSGHSDVILGAACTRDDDLAQALASRRAVAGAIPGALETFLAVRGMRTLDVRLERAEANARVLAERLASHPDVQECRYPGFGTIISFVTTGGPSHAQAVTEASTLIIHATSLGGVESTWERRRRHAGEPLTVPDALIRLSVGIEHVEDLWADIEAALGSKA